MTRRFLYQPFRFGRQGGGALTDDPDRHLRDKVMAVLFTAPGERVNNPDFGVGLNRVVFEGLDELLIGTLRFRISQGLQRELGDEIEIIDVELASQPEGGQLYLHIQYRRLTGRQVDNLEIKL